MPWAGGTFTRNNGTYSGSTVWQSDAAAAIKIRADRHDTHDQDIAQGINNCLTKDGQNSPTQHISWGNFKITNLADGVNAADAVNKGQLDGKVAKAGDTMTGALDMNLGTFSTTFPLRVAGDFTGNARFVRFENTNTSNAALAYFQATALGGSLGIGRASSNYTGTAAYQNRGVLEIDSGSGEMVYSANVHYFYVNGAADLRGRLSIGGLSLGSDPQAAADFLHLSGAAASQIATRFTHGSTLRGLIGISGTASQIISGSAANDMCLRTEGSNMRFSTGGGTLGMVLDSSSVLSPVGGIRPGGVGFVVTKVTVSNSAPGALTEGEIYFQY